MTGAIDKLNLAVEQTFDFANRPLGRLVGYRKRMMRGIPGRRELDACRPAVFPHRPHRATGRGLPFSKADGRD